MNNRVKNILIGVLLLLLIVSIIIIVVLLNRKEDKVLSVTGKVIAVGDNYVLLSSDNLDYVVNDIKGTYKLNDEVRFSYNDKEIDLESEPITIKKVLDEDIIKVSFEEEKEDNKEKETIIKDNITSNDNTTNNTDSSYNNSSTKSNNTNDKTSTYTKSNDNTKVKTDNTIKKENVKQEEPKKDADTEVLSYFNELNSDLESGSIKNSLKSSFISVVDFLFYNGTIKGHTFSDLTTSAKLKVLKIALYFDSKIDKYFPGYKESISSGTKKVYTNVKNKIVSTYLNITTSICNSNSELCSTAKKGFLELKKDFGLTWSLIKDIAGDGVANIKNWYEIWSGK